MPPGYSAALRAAQRWAARWKQDYPKAVERLERDLDELLAVYSVPAAHRRAVRATNAIERCFRELRRKTDRVGVFVDHASVERLIFGLISYQNDRHRCRPIGDLRRRESAHVG